VHLKLEKAVLERGMQVMPDHERICAGYGAAGRYIRERQSSVDNLRRGIGARYRCGNTCERATGTCDVSTVRRLNGKSIDPFFADEL